MLQMQRCGSWEYFCDEVNENLLASKKSSKIYSEFRVGRPVRPKNQQPPMKREYRTTCPDMPSDELSTSWEYLPTAGQDANVISNIKAKDDEKTAAVAAARKRSRSL